MKEWAEKMDGKPPPDATGELSKQLGKSYTIYGSMLILPSRLLESGLWKLVTDQGPGAEKRFFECVAKHSRISHIACTKPIPFHKDSSHSENIVRSPSNFTPLFGDFGPNTASQPPTTADIESAYWVTAKQNGIAQTWAPRWTMFSRGNISEKQRLLELPSVQASVEEGKRDSRGCAAVDLYAGIGYFTFSYLKAGFSKVLCWDLNPWSTEGLRRGAAANKWNSLSSDEKSDLTNMAKSDCRCLIFNESNEYAQAKIDSMRVDLPPIRHVNCGLLPTSKGSWDTAFAVLDPTLGGWVHVHENFEQSEIEQKAEEVRSAFQSKLDAWRSKKDREVKLEYINRVKTYAPGVYHVVLDIYVPPRQPS